MPVANKPQMTTHILQMKANYKKRENRMERKVTFGIKVVEKKLGCEKKKGPLQSTFQKHTQNYSTVLF